MKKILAFVALFACLLGLASCTTKVSGKTYVYDSFSYEISEDLTAIEKGVAELAATGIKKTYEVIELVFDAETEGDVWTQDGKTVTYGGVEYTVKGKKLVLSVSEDDYSYTVTLKQK